jgi:hypothetical protein
MNTQQTLTLQSYQEALPQELFIRILNKYKIVSIRQVTDGIIKPLLKDLKEAKAQFVATKTDVPTKSVATNTKSVATKLDNSSNNVATNKKNVATNNSTTTKSVATKLDRTIRFRANEPIDNKLVLLSKELHLTKSQVIRKLIEEYRL